ncbi:hypothetical protein [Mycobacterium sp. pR1184]|uniref:hypothetical protein n=1 Tax=Mycobacterium sp. pR1184 TaxID=3238981 RepID=UPI00351B09A4
MTETPESTIEPTTATGQPRYDGGYGARTRLSQVAAWVLIVAGTVFVVAVIFFSGLLLGWSSRGHQRGYYGGQSGGCPMMGQGGMMGAGGMMGPGGMGPGGPMRPQQTPSTTEPTAPHH